MRNIRYRSDRLQESRLITAALDDYSIFSFVFLVSAHARSSSDYRSGTALYGERRKICGARSAWHNTVVGMVVQGLHGFDGDRRDCWPHALWELHFCVLIRARCCSEDTGGRSFGLRLAPQARALRLGAADKLLQFTTRNYYQACCLLFTSRFCSRSPGIPLEGRADNSYSVELLQSINTHLYTHTLYCFYFTINSSLSSQGGNAACQIRSNRKDETAQANEHPNLTNTIEQQTSPHRLANLFLDV
jgi:hypothetical protein